MDYLSLQTKIKLNNNSSETKLININKDSFLIYNKEEIFVFNKNLSYKKLFLFNNDNKENNIKFIKYINKGKFLCLNSLNELLIFTINIKTKAFISKLIIKFKKNQIILDAIETKNEMILAITIDDLLIIKIKDNDHYEIFNLYKIKEENVYEYSLYELTKNIILISSKELCSGGSQSILDLEYITKEVIFDLNKCKIINNLINYDSYIEDISRYKIIIYQKYILILRETSIYLYNIYNYDLLKEFSFFNQKIFNFDENIYLALEIENGIFDSKYIFTLYDISDINNIKYQKLYFEKVKKENINQLFITSESIKDIKKISEEKIMVNSLDNILIFTVNKKNT